MDGNLSASAKRVQDALHGFGLDCSVKELAESTRFLKRRIALFYLISNQTLILSWLIRPFRL